MDFNNVKRERELTPQRFLSFGLASLFVHALLFLFVFFWLGRLPSVMFIAGGEGEGGNTGSGAIQVGVATAAELGFTRPQTTSYVGDNKKDKINNVRLQQVTDPEEVEDALPNKKKLDDEAEKTKLPVIKKEERLYTKKTQRASSDETTASVGTSYGAAKPAIQGGIGIGDGRNNGIGTGMPGGSEYGRRIQAILSRNFTPPKLAINGVSNVVVYVRISRSGQITSVVGGRVPKNYFKQPSANEQLNYAAERAIIAAAAQGLPPFPGNFLIGTQEAVAEVWFQYP
jgi:hypothetical protein